MHLVTHTGILSTVQSTAPHGTASARTLCSSTARVHEHHPHVFYPLVKHLANFLYNRLRLKFAILFPSSST